MTIAALSIVALYLFAALVYDVLWYRRRNRKVRRRPPRNSARNGLS
jgi:O-antigen/teichoic acid export membrane protein